MVHQDKILMGRGEVPVYLLPQMANRHGLIAGATGTGKTVTLKVMAEGLSDLGVPVFLADIKGDVSSLALAGENNSQIADRLADCGIAPQAFRFKGYPCRFWDVFGQSGIPVRATVSDVGPLLLSRLLDLTDAQEGVLNIAFHVADDNGWELLDFKDLRAMLTYLAEHRKEYTAVYGNIATQTVGAIQRSLLALEDAGAEQFFGEPQLNIADWMANAKDGRGVINVLHCVELAQKPLLYSVFMLWMLSELYENLPEVGDLDKPRLVFFFDEAHMLFTDAPKALVEKVVQVVKLIRSKGVGIYFITQSPADIPDAVLAQLNNRVQHALRAYTPAEQKAVRVAAQSFRPNPHFSTEDAISSMGTGVALVSMLDETGAPNVVQRAVICPPQSGFTPLEDAARAMVVVRDPLYAEYKDAVDNESAYEILTEEQRREEEAQAALAARKQAEKEAEAARKQAEREARAQQQYRTESRSRQGQSALERSIKKAARSTSRSVGRSVGRSITRGVLGTSNGASRAASTFAGSLMGDLFSSFFK